MKKIDKPPGKTKKTPKKTTTTNDVPKESEPVKLTKLSLAWQKKATIRGCEAAAKIIDDLFTQIAKDWADGDPRKVILYLLGAMQGIAVQLGRVESILKHSDHISHPELLRKALAERLEEGFKVICAASRHHDEKGGQPIPKHFEEIAMHIITGFDGSKKPETAEHVDNVISLPVFKKNQEGT